MAVTTGDESAPGLSESNTARRTAALRRKIRRQHRWRAQVWAECEIRINGMQDQLTALGAAQLELEEYDFLDPDALAVLAQAGDTDEPDSND